MGYMYYIMGKSSTGKDTIYRQLLRDESLSLCRVVTYTTRPIRRGEKEGEEYYFTDEETINQYEAQGKLIEKRVYHTVCGNWIYGTVEDASIDLSAKDYITIGTLEAYEKACLHYGSERVMPILIVLDDGVRLSRALARERKQENPQYEEMCRRFLADSEDFSEDKIKSAGIQRVFHNDELTSCLQEIKDYIRSTKE